MDKYDAIKGAIDTLVAHGINPFQRFRDLEPGTKFFWAPPRDGGAKQCQVVHVRGFGNAWSYVDAPCVCFQDSGGTGLVFNVVKP